MKLDGWNMDVLNNLLLYREIEREWFDFKNKELDQELEKHVCAMANTITGILCLGIKDPNSKSPTTIFKKDGFRIGAEDVTLHTIMSHVTMVEPIPSVTNLVLNDLDGKHFYVILKVEGSIFQRPYMIKDRGQIFVRIGSSSSPASRTTIVNLFMNQLERRHTVLKLQSHCSLLRSELIQISEVITTIDESYLGVIPALDLNAFKDAVLSAEWFLRDENILGQVNIGNSTGGVYTNIQELNVLSTTINILNKGEMNRASRYQHSKQILDKWKDYRTDFKNFILFLNDIIQRCGKYLQLNS
jgi:hypothetical protein